MTYKIRFLDGSVKEFDSLIGADLEDADLSYADLRRVDLRYAKLIGANLYSTSLHNAYLEGVIFRRADLRNANLSYADLRNANLTDTILRTADLTNVNLCNTIGNNKEIKTYQFEDYTVVIHNDIMQIGCQRHKIEDWFNFNDNEIDKMSDDALQWWNKNKKKLKVLLED